MPPDANESSLSDAGHEKACVAFEAMTTAFLAHGNSVPDHLAAVLENDPDHVLGWSAKALFSCMLARSELSPTALAAAARARASLEARGGSLRDRLFASAAGQLAAGDWAGAIATLEIRLEADPGDSLAAKLSHGLRFMTGDAEGMRRSIERIISQVGLGHRHAGFLLGCKAFALEETGAYREAEFVGRSAVEREPSDAWGMHAVSHIHEMTGRPEDGAAWIDSRRGNFGHCNNFRYHLFWHLALFRLELGDFAGVLDLYDTAIRAEQTDDFRDIANGASLLQRLELAGVPVGSRWEELADLCERRIEDRSLVFADLHYVMALAGAGRTRAADRLSASLGSGMGRSPLQAEIGWRTGADVAAALVAYRAGLFAEAAQRLLRARDSLGRIGGSHAQRDVFEQILIDAAVRSGHPSARALLMARLAGRRGRNRFADIRLRSGMVSALADAVAYSPP